MFNIGSGELVLIAVVALLLLGPKRLPELARGLGKFLREFRRQTDEVRSVVEREFYKMDKEMDGPPPPPGTPWHPPVPGAAPVPELTATAAGDTVATTAPGAPVAAPTPLTEEEDHKLLVPPDADPAVSQHTDPTPPHPDAAPAPVVPSAPDAAATEPAKKAS